MLVTLYLCGMQLLASLSIHEDVEPWRQKAYSPPQTELQLPETLPRLRDLHFDSFAGWDTLGEALWPLAVLAANSIPETEGECSATTDCAAGAMSQPLIAFRFA